MDKIKEFFVGLKEKSIKLFLSAKETAAKCFKNVKIFFIDKVLIRKDLIKKYSLVAFSVIVVIALSITSLSVGITLAYDVIYNGKNIATVKSKSDYNNAVNLAQSMVNCSSIRDYTLSPKFTVTFTVEENLTDTQVIAQNIIDLTDSISIADAVFIDGEMFGCFNEADDVDQYVQSVLDGFTPQEGEAESVFMNEVKIEKGYYPVENFVSKDSLGEKLSTIPVQTTVTVRKQISIPFKIESRKTDTRFVGEVVKIVNGEAGIEESVTHSVYLNGELQSTEVVETMVIKEPITEVTVIGTLPRTIDAETSAQVNSLGLIWPLKRVSNQIVSSYWGDGRGHKALDIASPSGTPIYAAQSGTVITSCYSSSYGNYIIIDHGNGWKTCYAHASKLYARVGEYVSQGQVIAAVGSTGQSTGNHLHFEVRKNNVKIDPAPFLGLY